MTRQEFLLVLPEALLAKPALSETARPKLLIVAAHPDDEYAVAATIYRHFGVPLTTTYQDATGRPRPIIEQGEPLRELVGST